MPAPCRRYIFLQKGDFHADFRAYKDTRDVTSGEGYDMLVLILMPFIAKAKILTAFDFWRHMLFAIEFLRARRLHLRRPQPPPLALKVSTTIAQRRSYHKSLVTPHEQYGHSVLAFNARAR